MGQAMQKGEAKLYSSLAVAAIQGKQITPGQFADSDKYGTNRPHVCLCGAVLTAAGIPFNELENGAISGEEIIRKVAKNLGITLKQAASLNNGFEDMGKNYKDSVAGASDFQRNPLADGVDKYWYGIGAKLRKVYDANQGES